MALYYLKIKLVYLKPAIILTQKIQPFPICTSHMGCRSHLPPSRSHIHIVYSPLKCGSSIYTFNNHGDTTQPCLNPTLTGNHSFISILTPTLRWTTFLLIHTLLINIYHMSTSRIICFFQIPKRPKCIFLILFYTLASLQTLGLCAI